MKNGLQSQSGTNLPRLDETDRKILGELTSEGRVSIAELGRRVNLSSPAAAERVQRLERAGVITGYRAELDPRMLGYQLTAIVRIKPAPRQLPRSSTHRRSPGETPRSKTRSRSHLPSERRHPLRQLSAPVRSGAFRHELGRRSSLVNP